MPNGSIMTEQLTNYNVADRIALLQERIASRALTRASSRAAVFASNSARRCSPRSEMFTVGTLPKAPDAAGIGYDELIQSCLLAAAKRQGIRINRNRRGKK